MKGTGNGGPAERPFRGARAWVVGLGLAAALLAAALPATAQTVRGRVLESDVDIPVAAALVTLIGADGGELARAMSSESGVFELRAPRPGAHRLRVARQGYATHTSVVFTLAPGETLEIEFRLAAEGIELAPLVVIGRRDIERGLDGFSRRRDLGRGVFIDPFEINRLAPSQPTDVFRRVGGLRLDPPGFGEAGFSIRSMRGYGCFVVFLDHSPDPIMVSAHRGGTMARVGVSSTEIMTETDLSTPPTSLSGAALELLQAPTAVHLDLLVHPTSLRGIEVYRDFSEVPREIRDSYRKDAIYPPNHLGGCGVAIIWTNVGW